MNRADDGTAMVAAFYILLFAGHLGFFDVLYFHNFRCRLHQRPECQREVLWHTARHFIYASQFVIIANLRLHGAGLLLLVLLFGADVFIAWSDVWEEHDSRRIQGGLPRGEYFMHIVLSVLIGAYLISVGQAVWPDRFLPTAVVVDPPPVAVLLRLYMTVMGFGAFGFFVHDLARWLRFRRGRAIAPGAA